MLAAATRRPLAVFAGLVLAALASSVVAAIAGIWIAATINIRAMTLMVALALLFAAASGLIRKQHGETVPRRFLLPAAFILCLAAEMGDRTQFLTFALAGRFASAPLAAAGATAGDRRRLPARGDARRAAPGGGPAPRHPLRASRRCS